MKIPNNSQSARGKLASLFFVLLFFGLGFAITDILNTKISKEQQTIKSQAQGLSPIQEATCTNAGGECQTGKADQVGKSCTLSDGTTPGTVVFNLCPQQGDDVRCCVPKDVPPETTQPPVTENIEASISVKLQGIGPNANIQNANRSASIKIFKDDGSLEAADYSSSDTLVFQSANGTFTSSSFKLGSLPSGKYQMVIQIEKYLDKQLSHTSGSVVFSVASGQKVSVAAVEMRAGDIAPGFRGDNAVNIIDYNALIGCFPGAPAGACLNKDYADLNDDGKVDQIDLDILMSNFGDNGFAFQTDQFSCAPDPSCNSGKDSLQLCSLLCIRKSQRS